MPRQGCGDCSLMKAAGNGEPAGWAARGGAAAPKVSSQKPPQSNERRDGDGAGTAGPAGGLATLILVGVEVVHMAVPPHRPQPLEGAEGHVRRQQAVPGEHRQAPAAEGQRPWGHRLRGLRPGPPGQVEAGEQRAHGWVLCPHNGLSPPLVLQLSSVPAGPALSLSRPLQ